ncbi:MAG: DUF371 domain-containing protein [Nitrososphaerota archaeon]|nr:DUF371 domain-containing protein [Nitrososphaerota archaeon]MDG6939385.1 DUF371 domain-containing protein [Nitrososphaerota archaeon]
MDIRKTELLDSVAFRGHPNVLATNRSTLEVTTEGFLTRRGDCIIGTSADRGCAGLSPGAREWLSTEGSRALLRVRVAGEAFELTAFGSGTLTHASPVSMVVRKSSYACPRTLAVRSSSAACDLPRGMVEKLSGGCEGLIEIYAVPANV